MAPRTVVLTILVAVSLVFADHVRGEQLGGSKGQELIGGGSGGGGGVSPKSQCGEERLYKGLCAELFCTTACLLQMRQGGHCKGSFIKGSCYCFTCS